MKHTLTLAAWNFRLARRSLLALWGIFAAQQLALVVFRICWQGAAGMGLASPRGVPVGRMPGTPSSCTRI